MKNTKKRKKTRQKTRRLTQKGGWTYDFSLICKEKSFEEAQRYFQKNKLYEDSSFLKYDIEEAFKYAFEGGKFETAKWLYDMAGEPFTPEQQRQEDDEYAQNPTSFISKKFTSSEPMRKDELIRKGGKGAFVRVTVHGRLDMLQWLQQKFVEHAVFDKSAYIKINSDVYTDAFRVACKFGHLEVAQWLLDIDPSININYDDNLLLSCSNGHLDIAKWLYGMYKERNIPIPDIGFDNAMYFVKACKNGLLDIAKFLLKVYVEDLNSRTRRDGRRLEDLLFEKDAFRFACKNRHLEVAQWLASLNPYYQIVNPGTDRWKCKILKLPTDRAKIIENSNIISRNAKFEAKKYFLWLESPLSGNPDTIFTRMPTDLIRQAASYADTEPHLVYTTI